MRDPRLKVMPLEEARILARVLKALAHPLRLQILRALEYGDSCLCDLHPFFRLNQSNLCRHIGILKQVGIVTERRAGPRVILHLATPGILKALPCAATVADADLARRLTASRAGTRTGTA
jgi:ArsR family transcriptional regulator